MFREARYRANRREVHERYHHALDATSEDVAVDGAERAQNAIVGALAERWGWLPDRNVVFFD